MTPRRLVLCLLIGAISGCVPPPAIQRAQTAKNAKLAMVGMSKEDVLACAGPPGQKDAEGATEVWSYASGNGATNTFSTASSYGQASAFGSPHYAFGNSTGYGFGSSHTVRRFCTVNVVMKNGIVAAVNYSGPTGGLITQGEQCAFAVANCVH